MSSLLVGFFGRVLLYNRDFAIKTRVEGTKFEILMDGAGNSKTYSANQEKFLGSH